MTRFTLCALCILLACQALPVQAQTPLDQDDLAVLIAEGLDGNLIARHVELNGLTFVPDTQMLLDLRKAGASDEALEAILDAAEAARPGDSASSAETKAASPEPQGVAGPQPNAEKRSEVSRQPETTTPDSAPPSAAPPSSAMPTPSAAPTGATGAWLCRLIDTSSNQVLKADCALKLSSSGQQADFLAGPATCEGTLKSTRARLFSSATDATVNISLHGKAELEPAKKRLGLRFEITGCPEPCDALKVELGTKELEASSEVIRGKSRAQSLRCKRPAADASSL